MTSVARLAAIAASGVGIADELELAAAGLPAPLVAPQPNLVVKMIFMSALTGAVQRAGAASDFNVFAAIKELNAALSEIGASRAHANALQNLWSKFPLQVQRLTTTIQTLYEATWSSVPRLDRTAVTSLAVVARSQGLIQTYLSGITAGLPASA
jgi:hypothetical protein